MSDTTPKDAVDESDVNKEVRDLIGEVKRQMDCRTEITMVGYPHVLIDSNKILSVIDTITSASISRDDEVKELRGLVVSAIKMVLTYDSHSLYGDTAKWLQDAEKVMGE